MTVKTSGSPYLEYGDFREYGWFNPGGWNNHLPTGGKYYHHVGADTPQYHRRRRRGELLPINSFVSEEWAATMSGAWSITGGPYGPDYYAIGTGFMPAQWGAPTNVYSTTEAQFVEAINLRYLAQQAVGNLAGEFDVGTFVMEDVRELPGMFRESVRRLEKYWDDRSSNLWRRRGYRDMRKAQKQIANDYLAINFGLSPLVSSIRDLVDLSENWAKERHRSSVRAGTAGVVVEAIEHTQNEFTALWTLTTNWQLSAVGYAIGNQAARKFYVDAASTAWELTKFSWMVDYLYDVGTWLRASSALRYDPSIMSSVGYELKMSTTGVLSLLEARNGYNVSLSAQSQWDTTKKRRVGISTANLKPTLRNPLDLGISQAMNVVAVIKQALG